MVEVEIHSIMHLPTNMVPPTIPNNLGVIGMVAVTTAIHSPFHLQDGNLLLQGWMVLLVGLHRHLLDILMVLGSKLTLHLLRRIMAVSMGARIGMMTNLIIAEVVMLTEVKVVMGIEAAVIHTKGMVAIVERKQSSSNSTQVHLYQIMEQQMINARLRSYLVKY